MQRNCTTLEKYDEDSSRTAGLDRKIEVKIMLRHNVDICLELVAVICCYM